MSAAEDWAVARLGHRFQEPRWLEEALTHSSAEGTDYQRLEFVGDRVLGCAVAAWLFEAGEADVGAMARRLAALVDRNRCAAVARGWGADEHMRLDRGARGTGVHRSDNALADVAEALIGAVFLDAGYVAAEAFVRRHWAQHFEVDGRTRHPKAELQEWALGRGYRLPDYETVAREGPDHAPRFRVRLTVTGQPSVEAMGSSKGEAERNAAEALLARLKP